MPKLTIDEIRQRFSSATDFNEIFDAFEAALNGKIEDIELYRLLFWNDSLTPDELCLFGEKLAQVFPDLAYDVYMWLAKVFEVTYSMYDNYELTLQYFNKAASVKPDEAETYIAASDCYEADLNIPPINYLIEFLKQGLEYVKEKTLLFKRLSELYEKGGDEGQSQYYRKKAEEGEGLHPEQ
ncbi:MAG: hypothetical protein KKF20_06460 [Bacteroidetes bacterium]|nr:hypothetical protein [Bacteroidota bacterium]MBU1422375.1 hypothetical protein [Bacteroidota bacterium]MBU2472032.1 hypothetical protein [Bacteroidota bacterium]MBU2636187.1 hypothetical protein [Bacteroidota bacterium]